MPIITQDLKKEHKALIRRILVRKPDASLREIREALEEINRPLDLMYISSIVKKIHREQARRIDHQTVNVELAKYEELVQEMITELWKIVRDKTAPHHAKVAAIRGVVEAWDKLLQRKFDAGIFERKLGEMVMRREITHEHRVLILNAIRNFYGNNDLSQISEKH